MQRWQDLEQNRVRVRMLSGMRISGQHRFILAKFAAAWRVVFSMGTVVCAPMKNAENQGIVITYLRFCNATKMS
jgi:hypothetical protein